MRDTPGLREAVTAEIRAHMARKRTRSVDLAAALGVSVSWVTRRLNGQIELSVDDVDRICGVLGVDPVSLFRHEVTAA